MKKTKEVKTTKKDQNLTDKYRQHKDDTGSMEVQVTLLTERISNLANHMKEHHLDQDSRRGLLILVGKRRRLLNYIAKQSQENYDKLIKDLGLRK